MRKVMCCIVLVLSLTSFVPFFTKPVHAQVSTLTESDRIYGLSTVWAEVKRNFIFYDKISFDWDSLYQSSIPRVQNVSDDEYYAFLQQVVNLLNDGHTNIFPPADVYQRNWKRVPLRTILLEDRVFVRNVCNDTLKSRGIVPGLEIVRINGMEVHQYAQQKVMPDIPGSTPQFRRMVTYNGMLTKGPEEQKLTITFKDKKGHIFDETISRLMADSDGVETLYRGTPLEEAIHMPFLQYIHTFINRNLLEPFKFKRLSNDVGYLWIGTFNEFGFKSQFDALYGNIQSTKALIIDLRGNVGGSTGYAEYVLRHLTSQPFKGMSSESRKYIPYRIAHGGAEEREVNTAHTIEPFKDREIYTKPVIILVDSGTHSAAEDFCAIFRGMKRGLLIGTTTAGSTGQALQIPLPGGGILAICTVHDILPDGGEFVGIGFQPDIEVKETISSYFAGNDLVLERALQSIEEK